MNHSAATTTTDVKPSPSAPQQPKAAVTLSGCMLFRNDKEWLIQVGSQCASLPIDASGQQVAEKLAGLFQGQKAVTRRCVLALASDDCFFVRFECPHSIPPKDRDAIRFELEQHLPLDAESMASDSLYDESSNTIAAVATQADRQIKLIDAIEQRGVEVVSIIPLSFLIARAVAQQHSEKTVFELLLADANFSESLLVTPNGVLQWRQFYDADDMARHFAVVGKAGTERDHVVVGTNQLGFKPGESITWNDQAPMRLAAQGVEGVLRSRWGNWPNLRLGALASSDPLFAVAKPLRWLAISATLCFMTLFGAAWYRENALETQSKIIAGQQRQRFQDAYPGRRVPVMLMRTVRNEHRKMLGSRGRGDEIDLPIPATTILRNLYQGLELAQRQENSKQRLIDITIDDGTCALTVRTVDSAHIGTIAKSLESVGFRVQPPATEQIDPSKEEPIATYQSTINAVWVGLDVVESAGGQS